MARDASVQDGRLHPEDRSDGEESGPWIAAFVLATAVWAALTLAEGRLPEGLARATAHVVSTLLAAPVAAAAVVQDARAFDLRRRAAAAAEAGVDADLVESVPSAFGRIAWIYGLLAVLFPPAGVVYLLDRRRRTD